jgi:hypothetical protein
VEIWALGFADLFQAGRAPTTERFFHLPIAARQALFGIVRLELDQGEISAGIAEESKGSVVHFWSAKPGQVAPPRFVQLIN